MDSGIYIAVFWLSEQRRNRVGRLGQFLFVPVMYFYVGSAQRNLAARIERHARQDKPLHWHIDYLSAMARMLGAILVPGARRRECELAEKLRSVFRSAVPGFGSSDCRCPRHLFSAPSLP